MLTPEGIEAYKRLSSSSLIVRMSTIAVPPINNPPLESYFNDNNILAVNGELEKKVHFCYLIGGIPDSTVPNPEKHLVIEFLYNNINEKILPDYEELPNRIPSKIAGFALLVNSTRPSYPEPAGIDLLNEEFPELEDERNIGFSGNQDGGMFTSGQGNLEFISQGGKSISFSNTLRMNNIRVESSVQGNDNTLNVANTARNGELLGVAMPNVLPLAPVTLDPMPNIQGIADLYVKIRSYADAIETIKELTEVLSE
jgi:hypothetical protein